MVSKMLARFYVVKGFMFAVALGTIKWFPWSGRGNCKPVSVSRPKKNQNSFTSPTFVSRPGWENCVEREQQVFRQRQRLTGRPQMVWRTMHLYGQQGCVWVHRTVVVGAVQPANIDVKQTLWETSGVL